MTKFILRLIRLIVGLFVFTCGLVLAINANLGMAPWNCLNSGIIRWIPITFGQANIAVGILLVCITFIAKEKIGLGTVGNMLLVGTYMDIIEKYSLIPKTDNLITGLIMICLGLIVSSIGVFVYLGSGFGAGPRDGLMLALMKWTGKPLAFCRTSIEVFVLVFGVALGGSFGIGTILASAFNGMVMQTTFKIFKFNPKGLKHEYIDDYFRKGIK